MPVPLPLNEGQTYTMSSLSFRMWARKLSRSVSSTPPARLLLPTLPASAPQVWGSLTWARMNSVAFWRISCLQTPPAHPLSTLEPERSNSHQALAFQWSRKSRPLRQYPRAPQDQGSWPDSPASPPSSFALQQAALKYLPLLNTHDVLSLCTLPAILPVA